jgi:hypothetical protein
MSFGPFLFAAPWALTALIALPALWWLLRATPPPPSRAQFPPTRLLLEVKTEEQSRERAPWWILLFRALAAAMLIIAFARPSLAPSPAAQAAGGRTLIVIDNGWTSAPFWAEARAAADATIAEAERANAPVFLLETAPQIRPRDPAEAMTAADARIRVARMNPQPWRPDRDDAAKRLQRSSDHFARIVWVSDGLDDGGAHVLAETLKARGPVVVRTPSETARALVAGAVTPQGVEVTARRALNGLAIGAVAAETIEGRALGAAPLNFLGGLSAHARIVLPPEIAARTARVRIVGEPGAGAVRLLPAGAGRPFVGLIDPGSVGQPLLSEIFYAERALQPYASLQHGTVPELIAERAQALILPDASPLTPSDREALGHWLDGGGLLIRFAGPRLANDADELLPVRLRPGSRTLGGALAWEQPLNVAAFPDDSPFAGLQVAHDMVVRRQVLAEPASLESARVWARLTDNSPLVTAQTHGHGLIVLYHTSAAPDWSDLPLSGMFVEMLRRTLAFSGRSDGAGERVTAGGPYAPTRLIDGYGVLAPAPQDAQPIAAERFALAIAGPTSPPGLYERSGVSAAIDAARPDEELKPLALPGGVARSGLRTLIEQPLAGYFFGLAALMLALDLFVSLFLAGRLPRFGRASTSVAALLLALALIPHDARAQSFQSPYSIPRRTSAEERDPTLTLHLAYVRTGDARVDRTSAAGLSALSETLRERTSVEPGAPVPVDLARDDLSIYPFLYWPAPSSPQHLSDAALANLERYLAVGGLLLVDTRDAGSGASSRRPAETMLAGLDAPPLEPVTDDNIVAHSFFLLRSFPGRALAPKLWAESASAAQSRDGVAALFVGDGDWAAAWSPEAALAGGARQREMALRFGVNIVMVALTGNYKSDQVHLPALLERMGRGQ